jgi:hypothetical protein
MAQAPMSKKYRKLSPIEDQELTKKVLEKPYGPIKFKGRTIRLFGTNKKDNEKN